MYDLKISIISMSVAKILSEVNRIYTDDFRLNKQRFRVDKCIFLARLNDMHFPLYHSVHCNSVTNARGIFNFHSYYVEKLRTFRSSELSMKYSIFTT